MNAKRYLRGMLGQGWYNFTECLAWAILYRKMPEELEYHHKVAYGPKKREWINTISRKDLAGQKKPLFVYIHGGGWNSGITDMRNTYIMNWAKKEFFCASIGYTWTPQMIYPGQVQEVYDALDFILDHAEEWGFDPDNAVVAGESAGAGVPRPYLGVHTAVPAGVFLNRASCLCSQKVTVHLTFVHV